MLVKKLFREKQFFEMNSFSREKGLDFIEVSNAFFFFYWRKVIFMVVVNSLIKITFIRLNFLDQKTDLNLLSLF